MYPHQIQTHISNDLSVKGYSVFLSESEMYKNVFDKKIPHNVLTQLIWKTSRIELKDYYKTCALISYRTCNNQVTLDSLPFYVWNNLGQLLNEILEEENKNENGQNANSSANDMYAKQMGSAKDMMSSMKSSMPKF